MLCNGILRSIKFNCDLLEPRTTFIFMSSESRWYKMILVNACDIFIFQDPHSLAPQCNYFSDPPIPTLKYLFRLVIF